MMVLEPDSPPRRFSTDGAGVGLPEPVNIFVNKTFGVVQMLIREIAG